MKKTTALLTLLAIIGLTAFAFAGCTNEMVEQSKLLVEEYYNNFAAGDEAAIVDLFSDDLIADHEGQEYAEIIVGSRIGILGEDFEYEITSEGYNDEDDSPFVVIEAQVTYDSDGETYVETFQFEQIDEELKITAYDLEDEKIVTKLPEAYFEKYNNQDIDGAKELLSGSWYDVYTEEELGDAISSDYNALGKLLDMQMYDEYSLNLDKDGELIVKDLYYNASFESGSADINVCLCNDGGEIKIYNIIISPDFIDEVVETLFSTISSGDYEAATALYNDAYYAYTGETKDELIGYLSYMDGFGDYTEKEIINWYYCDEFYGDASLGGCIVVILNTTFGDTVLYNEVTILPESGEYKIIDHYIDYAQ